MGIIIDCNELSRKRRQTLQNKIHQSNIIPGLAVILVGEDPASRVYVKNKVNACKNVGIRSQVYEMRRDSTTDEVTTLIEKLAFDDSVHGILVQLPLPSHINTEKVINTIPPSKDVDSLTSVNIGRLVQGSYDFAPCTPLGIMQILTETCGSVSGANCVVVGRSNIVGKPMSIMLTQNNATVTLCHSHTEDVGEHTKHADILITSVGKIGFITAEMVQKDAVVIDVGINRLSNGKITGDVCFDKVLNKATAITPVPGGVGLMTVTALLENTCKAAILQKSIY